MISSFHAAIQQIPTAVIQKKGKCKLNEISSKNEKKTCHRTKKRLKFQEHLNKTC